jgi:hypothetical protein
VFTAVVEFYVFLAGCLALVIEGGIALSHTNWVEDFVNRNAPFMYTLSGRGAFYFFFGSLMAAQFPNVFDFLAGCYWYKSALLINRPFLAN